MQNIFTVKEVSRLYYNTYHGYVHSIEIPPKQEEILFTERQSGMLPDLSVQRKTTNAPQLKIY